MRWDNSSGYVEKGLTQGKFIAIENCTLRKQLMEMGRQPGHSPRKSQISTQEFIDCNSNPCCLRMKVRLEMR